MQHGSRPRASPAEPLIALLVIVVTLGVFALAWFVPAHARLVAEVQERECRAHLQAIYQAIQHYRADHHGSYPDSLVEAPQVFRRQPPITHLAPQYLAASQLLCASDQGGGVMLGWNTRCSYLYGLQELMSPVPEVRRRVWSGLIQRYGPKLRLIICPSLHRIGPMGFLTLHADVESTRISSFRTTPRTWSIGRSGVSRLQAFRTGPRGGQPPLHRRRRERDVANPRPLRR
jgi:hypothetical protein